MSNTVSGMVSCHLNFELALAFGFCNLIFYRPSEVSDEA